MALGGASRQQSPAELRHTALQDKSPQAGGGNLSL